jgi:hypothetical protein
MPGQDYQPIELWYSRKEEGYKFSESLLRSMLEDAGVGPISADAIFGHSYFDTGDYEKGEQISAYRPGTTLHRRFQSLARKDSSFSKYLSTYGIQLDTMHLLKENERASIIRKGTSAVAVRENYRAPLELLRAPTRQERSRKTPILYTGSQSVFAIIEENPRWFIGIVGPMLRAYKTTSGKVPRNVQANTITTSTNRFRALLRTIPYKPPNSSSSRGLLTLLDNIGETFHQGLVGGQFNPDPPLSFIVDSDTPPETVEALGRALNAGAIILASEHGGDALLSSLRDKRFRLSYMLAPGYGIPLTLGRPLALSKVLARSGRNEPQLNLLGRDD